MADITHDDRDPIGQEIDNDFYTRLYATLMKADSIEMRRFSDGKSLVLIHDGRVTHRGVDDSLNTALLIAWNKMRIMRVPCDDCGRTDGTHDMEIEH